MNLKKDVLNLYENDYEKVDITSDKWLSTDDLQNEIWRDIDDFAGLYQVSNYGRVKSLGNKPRNKYMKDHILKQGYNSNGYLLVVLYKDKHKYTKKVHVLVAKAFIPNPENKPAINHWYPVDKNTRCCNNCLYNLSWVTMKENMQHCKELGRSSPPPRNERRGKTHNQSKPIIQFTLDGVFVKQWWSIGDACRAFGLSHKTTSMSRCAKGLQKQAYGYVWKFGIYED